MKKLYYLVFTSALFGVVLLHGCRKAVEIPTFTVGNIIINDDGYTSGGTLVLLYSLDNGETFTNELPIVVPLRGELMVKLNNGTSDLATDNFNFDWSASSIEPDSATLAIVTFKVFGEFAAISVIVNDNVILITSHRATGEFSSIDVATGVITPLFTATTDGNDLTDVRGFVYHENQNKFYMSQASFAINGANRKGFLYTIDPVTKVSTVINANNGVGGAAIWDAVNNWGVVADDSLLGYGDFNGDGNGLVKFGIDGGRSANTLLVNNVCCGLGMLFRENSAEMIVGNSWGANNGEVIIDRIDMNNGMVTNVITTANLIGFPIDMSLEWLTMKALAENGNGKVYGILYPTGTQASYFVSIDMSAMPSVTYISTLGEGKLNQFNMLAYVPSNIL